MVDPSPAASRRTPDARPPVALVTGASRGIGRAIAVRLAADGYTVAVNSRSDGGVTVKEVEAAGGTAFAVPGDIRTDLDAIFDAAGEVDVLVNNAGVRRDGLAMLMKQDAWDDVLETNLAAAFRASQRALRGMLKRRWGRIVNVASVVGLRGSPGQANYAAAKAGLVGLTRALAVEVASRGITVNAVAPGIVRTDMTASLGDERLEALRSMTPIGRTVEPSEVAAAVAFLASPDAAAITGHVLCVDGGMTA